MAGSPRTAARRGLTAEMSVRQEWGAGRARVDATHIALYSIFPSRASPRFSCGTPPRPFHLSRRTPLIARLAKHHEVHVRRELAEGRLVSYRMLFVAITHLPHLLTRLSSSLPRAHCPESPTPSKARTAPPARAHTGRPADAGRQAGQSSFTSSRLSVELTSSHRPQASPPSSSASTSTACSQSRTNPWNSFPVQFSTSSSRAELVRGSISLSAEEIACWDRANVQALR